MVLFGLATRLLISNYLVKKGICKELLYLQGICKVKPKRQIKKQPKDFPIYSPQSQVEQYEIVLRRKESRNYLEAKFKCELCYRGYRLTSTYNKHMAKHDSVSKT